MCTNCTSSETVDIICLLYIIFTLKYQSIEKRTYTSNVLVTSFLCRLEPGTGSEEGIRVFLVLCPSAPRSLFTKKNRNGFLIALQKMKLVLRQKTYGVEVK